MTYFDFLIAITSILTSFIAVYMGWRFYARFGRDTHQWGWLFVVIGTISLAVSEVFDAYSTIFHSLYTEISDFFAILAEILLTIGFVRLFNRELVNEKIRQRELEENLSTMRNLLFTSMQMGASLNLDETLLTFLKRTIVLTGADLAVIYVKDLGEKHSGKYISTHRESNRIIISDRELGEFTQQVLITGRPLLISNIRNVKQNLSFNPPKELTAMGGFQLHDRGEILGVLFVGFNQFYSFSNCC